jgi:exodeoxyribonuclease-3
MSELLVATWNINSIRARLDRLLAWLERRAPDVACLQETKCTDDQFPFDQIRAAGYEATVLGQPTYNGVAILTRRPAGSVVRGLPGNDDDAQARFVSADVDGLRVASVYVPNGKEVGSDKYEYKLAWLERLRAWLEREAAGGSPLVVCGDYNIAPSDDDAAFPDAWAASVLCHADVRAAWDRLTAAGLRDLVREHAEPPGPWTWWDYRSLAFPRGDGLRIDHLLATPAAADRCVRTEVDRDERKGEKPSDHAPVLAWFST